MPQVFQVLRCYKCLVFQVHQTKKSNKWECKLCGEKQSIKRHYGLGTGKECRLHVQKLNGIRGEVDELSESLDINTSNDEQVDIKLEKNENILQKPSKWSNYVDREENHEPKDDPMFLGNTEVVLEVPKKKRKFNNPKIVKVNLTESRNKVIEPTYYDEKILESNDTNTLVDNSKLINNTFGKPTISTKTSKVLEKHSSNINANNKQDHEIQDKPKKAYEFVPPKVNKNSKWAQFTDDENIDAILPVDEDITLPIDEGENKNITLPIDEEFNENITLPIEKEDIQVNNSNLFSLCDDNELDNVLAF